MGRNAGAENTRTTSETGNVGDTLCVNLAEPDSLQTISH